MIYTLATSYIKHTRSTEFNKLWITEKHTYFNTCNNSDTKPTNIQKYVIKIRSK